MKLRILLIGLTIVVLGGVAAIAATQTTKKSLTAKDAQSNVDSAVDFVMDVLSARADMYYHDGDYPNAVRIFRSQMELDPYWVESYDQAAYLLWSLEKFDEAEAVYKKGIALNPKNYRLYFELGHMYYRTAGPSLYKKTGAASKKLYEQAVDQLFLSVKYPHPDDVDRLLAHTLNKLGRHEEERTVLQNVLKRNPTDAIALRDLQRLDDEGK